MGFSLGVKHPSSIIMIPDGNSDISLKSPPVKHPSSIIMILDCRQLHMSSDYSHVSF
jgi:hypothetical protein